MSDFESDVLLGSPAAPRGVPDTLPSSPVRRSSRLAMRSGRLSPASFLKSTGISLTPGLRSPQVASLAALLTRNDSSPSPLPPSTPLPPPVSGKRTCKSSAPPAKRRKGRPSSSQSTGCLPGPASASAPDPTPLRQDLTSAPEAPGPSSDLGSLLPPASSAAQEHLLTSSLVTSIDTLQRSVSMLSTLLQQGVSSAVATSSVPFSFGPAIPPPAPQPPPSAFTLASTRPVPPSGHQSAFCPSLPFKSGLPAAAPPQPLLKSNPVERYGRQLLQRRPSQVGLPTPHLSRQEPSRLQELVSRFLSTPIHVPVLASFLTHYPDRLFVDFLITGLTQGFFIGLPQLPASSLVIPNLQSALNDPNAVSQLLQKEVSKGYVIGPCASPPFSHFRVHPLGVAVRKYSGKKRLILDLSAPHSGPHLSINSLIPKPPFSLHYATIDHVVALIKTAGPGAWLAKADITDAFKIMPVHPSQWHLLGAKWDAKFYFFVRLSFGCRSSPSLFNSLSEALCWILLNVVRLPFVLHLLDDFLLIDPPSHSSRSLSELKALFNRVGVPLSEEKTVGPSKRLEFLGITLDSKEMVASLPADKLSRIREISQAHLSSTTLSKRQLLSLLGHLNFAMRIIPQGRSFISRLLDLANSVPSLFDQVVLDAGCRSDLAFWSSLLNSWNSISFFMIMSFSRQIPCSFSRTQPRPQVSGAFFRAAGSQRNGLIRFQSPSPLPFMKSFPSLQPAAFGEGSGNVSTL
ncbi:proline-rich protein 36-like [Poecilia formosa]|uniref:proline-rich protein 36-like n=1 Tax=Poecilia formosa TaxID=48698 RepID=UPI0007B8B674|nr:PREDICTED: proline-rich protein 36-like [Poecilia formosa]